MHRMCFLLLTCLLALAPIARAADEADPLTQAKIDRVKSSIHGMQLAIERWSVDNANGDDAYPDSINQLVVPTDSPGPYLFNGLYYNPFAPGAEGEANARQVPFGDWTPAHAGNFSYLVKYNDAGESAGYLLLAYGPMQGERTFDMTDDGAPDGIIISLVSGTAVADNPAVFYDNGHPVEITWAEKVAVIGEPE